MPVTVTDTAAREIESIIKQQSLDAEKIHLRVGVKGGGCSGFSYLLDLTEVQKDSDERWSYDYTLKDEDNERDVSDQRRLRSEVLPVSERDLDRLQGRADGTRIRLQQSECNELMWMRLQLLSLTERIRPDMIRNLIAVFLGMLAGMAVTCPS